jgi:hypothetical protein
MSNEIWLRTPVESKESQRRRKKSFFSWGKIHKASKADL